MQGKEFTVKIDNSEVTLLFKKPTHAELMEIDLIYRKMYSEALRQGIMVEAEAKKHFKNNGAWNKESEDKIRNLSMQIAMLEKALSISESSEDENMKLVENITKLRAELIELISDRTSMFSNTAEGLANEQKMHKFAELCCYNKENDEKFFNDRASYEKFVVTNPDILSEIYKQAYLFEYGLPEDITSEWGEVKYLKKIADKKIEEKEMVGVKQEVKTEEYKTRKGKKTTV